MERIQTKSYKNLVSIKRKTMKTLKKYYDINKFNTIKATALQNMSWFNDFSRSISIMDKTNITNHSSLPKSKNSSNTNISLFAIQKRGAVKKSCINRIKRGISKVTCFKIRKSISTNSWANPEKNDKYKMSYLLSKKWQQKKQINKLPKPSKFKENTMLPNKVSFLYRLNALKYNEKLHP